MKSILKSIKPKWTAKILNGEKTIEVSKTAPKDWVDYLSGKTDKKPEPKTVYIYCTKEDDLLRLSRVEGDIFVRGKDFDIKDYYRLHSAYNGKGKVVAKFTLREVETIKLPYTKFGSVEWVGCEDERTLQTQAMNQETLLEKSCLEEDEIYGYLNFKHSHNPYNVGCAWHISDLVIFDRPRELSEFIPPKWEKCGVKDKNGLYQCDKCPYGDKANVQCKRNPLTKAPESWCYVEERYPGATMRKIELPKKVDAKPYKKGKR